jgi:hypothetical protein
MTKDDVLFGYRQQLFAEAARTNVSAAFQPIGVHGATYYAWEKWGGIVVSANGVWKVLCRPGLNIRAKRLGLIAGHAAP